MRPVTILLLTTVFAAAASVAAAIVASGMAHPIPILGTFASLTLSKNPGIAFSLPIPSPWKEIVILIALAAILWIAFQSRRDKFLSVAFGLIIGGAIGNLLDRIADGYVTDYFAVGRFPIFNVADSCITIGAVLVILLSLRKKD